MDDDRQNSEQTIDVAADGASKEEDMRPLLLTLTAGAGLGLIFFTTAPAVSITITTPAGVRQAADTLDLAEAVHCRRYAHRHRRGHGWSRGCRKVIIVPRGSGGVVRGELPRTRPLAPVGRPAGNFFNPNNPQDRSGNSNPQDMTQPRAFNPQDMR
jgi:hypothetical protein